jgi:hypothetical protein
MIIPAAVPGKASGGNAADRELDVRVDGHAQAPLIRRDT